MVETKEWFCSFCGLGTRSVQHMIAGHGQAGICNECAESAMQQMNERLRTEPERFCSFCGTSNRFCLMAIAATAAVCYRCAPELVDQVRKEIKKNKSAISVEGSVLEGIQSSQPACNASLPEKAFGG